MGSRFASKWQWGKETTRGTAVAADTMLPNAEIKGVPDDRKPKFIEDAIGVRAKSFRSEDYTLLVEDTLSLHDLSFQQLAMLLSITVKGGVTPAEQTPSQADYLWDFSPSMTGDNTLDALTVELGDDQQAYEMEYFMGKSLKLASEIPQEAGDAQVTADLDFFARQVTPTTFTGALSAPTMTDMNGKFSRLYKDALWANKGTTELTDILRAWELEIIGGAHPKMMGSAAKTFNTHGQSYIEVMLTLTLESVAAANTLYTEMRAGTAKAYSLQVAGSAIGSGDPHLAVFDVWGRPERVVPMDSESNGNNLYMALIHGMYDPTGATIFNAALTTNVSAI